MQELPLCNPDFIYLDGPDQFNVLGKLNGITTKHKDMTPMSCDILKIEHFLNPDSIISIDGRRANANFLKCNLQKNWIYNYSSFYDLHYFQLKESPLGVESRKIINFYKKNKIYIF